MCDSCGCGEKSFEDKVAEVIQTIRPMLQGDGGDIELVGVDEDNSVRVRLQGACKGCPGAQMTLKNGVERLLLEKVPEVIARWEKQGIPKSAIGFNQSMPDKDLTIQGEVMTYMGELYLLYTNIKKPMNMALKKQQLHASGLKAKLLLEHSVELDLIHFDKA